MTSAALGQAILAAHLAVIVFNVAGLAAIPLGAALGWRWVRVRWWRALHVASWAVVALQAALGRACFLTLWQDALTGAAAQPPLIQRWVERAIYWPLPIWVFAASYLVLFGAVIALWWIVPARRMTAYAGSCKGKAADSGRRGMADGSVQGFTQDRYAPVREAFEANFASGADVGASFCATQDGETVVDLWGGFADAAKTRSWEKDTIVNVYSTTKTMTFLTALLIADRGELDFDAPVARYWPEFAAGGKADIKVSYLMAHSAGLSGWRERVTTEDLYDWDKMTSLLAAQAPLWEPGTASGYHAITQGYLVGEVVRRITGKSLGTVFREEIAEPLGADFWIGLPASEDARVAELIPPAPGTGAGEGQQTEIQKISFNNPVVDVSATRTRGWRGAEIPAAGGTGNARSVAEIHTILANGGVAKGKRFMSEAGCRKALELQIEGSDLVLGMPARFGMGFGLAGGTVPLPNPRDSMYWGGYGGSIIMIDMKARTTLAYAMNKMAGTTQGDMRAFSLAMAAWTAFGVV